MSKTLISLPLAALFALSTGCIIVTGNGSDTDTDATTSAGSTSSTGTDGTTDGTGTDGTTDGTGTESASATDATSTTSSETDATVTASASASESASESASATDTDGTGTDSDTDGALPCGWNMRENYYDCEGNGGVPGAEDPMMLVPYACPDQPLEVEGKCGDVDNLGCCDAEGNLWYCDETLVTEMCGG